MIGCTWRRTYEPDGRFFYGRDGFSKKMPGKANHLLGELTGIFAQMGTGSFIWSIISFRKTQNFLVCAIFTTNPAIVSGKPSLTTRTVGLRISATSKVPSKHLVNTGPRTHGICQGKRCQYHATWRLASRSRIEVSDSVRMFRPTHGKLYQPPTGFSTSRLKYVQFNYAFLRIIFVYRWSTFIFCTCLD